AVAAFGANLLQLKPCIAVHEGKMMVGKKYRGKFDMNVLKYIADRLGDGSNVEDFCIFVTHAGLDRDFLESCVAKVKKIIPTANVHITRAGCTISSHCGRSTIGVLFVRKA
ncbi:MAG: DegV family protein, partial [Clostridia bacterium]|nr:DegV family protein [Clostridia bacterium]